MLLLEIGKGKLTVGKIYGGLLILENWKQTKFGGLPLPKVTVYPSVEHSKNLERTSFISTSLQIINNARIFFLKKDFTKCTNVSLIHFVP